ncbi:hypothetical protein PHLCEN_2v12208 [Hermanssonia centrifuga]|uniref:Uncharacterized protein n=1 Tax=Hermanssonia centrifuga TaxID=98765 RepID=A0A2R6NIB2_9APHY|nr:hypothetical protein PHLCEN_2v12208 [Hermanssonia centrifuga]
MPIVLLGAVYYLPVYFQAVKGSGPINSGVLGFGLALTTAPFGILFGASVARTHRYRPQAYLCWSLAIIGAGLLTLLKVDSSKSMAAGFEIVLGIGLGGISTLTYFPVLSPLPVTQNAQALAFFAFTRNFGQIWGVTIGATVLQNGLVHKLPSSFIKEVAVGGEIAYSIIPLIPTLNAGLRQEAQEAFTDSLRVVWQVLIGIAGIGLLASFGMAHVPLHTHTDEDWQMEQRKSEVDSELLKQSSKDTIA